MRRQERSFDTNRPERSVRIAALVVGLWLAASPAAAAGDRPRDPAARPLTIATPGGALQEALQKTFFGPFAAQAHVGIRTTTWDGTLLALQDRARAGADPADRDLVLMDNSSVLVACQQGLVLPIDAAPPAAGADGRDGTDAGGRCGRPALRKTLVLAWDKSRMDTAPNWSEFWDVARLPGKRGLARDPRGTLEIALLADGVAADDVYPTLGRPEGVDRAFRKLDQLRPYIVWWERPAEAVRIMQSGAVLMTSAPSGDVQTADLVGHRDFALQWQQSISTLLSWAVPGRPPIAGSGRDRGAGDAVGRLVRVDALLSFIADPARQAAFVESYPAVSPMRTAPAEPVLPEDSPATPQHRRDALRQDDDFWAAHLEALQARFDSWIGKTLLTRAAP